MIVRFKIGCGLGWSRSERAEPPADAIPGCCIGTITTSMTPIRCIFHDSTTNGNLLIDSDAVMLHMSGLFFHSVVHLLSFTWILRHCHLWQWPRQPARRLGCYHATHVWPFIMIPCEAAPTRYFMHFASTSTFTTLTTNGNLLIDSAADAIRSVSIRSLAQFHVLSLTTNGNLLIDSDAIMLHCIHPISSRSLHVA